MQLPYYTFQEVLKVDSIKFHKLKFQKRLTECSSALDGHGLNTLNADPTNLPLSTAD